MAAEKIRINQDASRRRVTMKFQNCQKMAKGMGVSTHRMKKTDMIRAIQRAENNVDCYSTDRVDMCGELSCLWRADCVKQNHANRLEA